MIVSIAKGVHNWVYQGEGDFGRAELYRCSKCEGDARLDADTHSLPALGCNGLGTQDLTRLHSDGRLVLYIYLDDERSAPPGWVRARTVPEAKSWLLTGAVEGLSLDHDLGLDDQGDPLVVVERETGYDLCKWMAENSVWPKLKPAVHSANPVGAANMRSVIDRYGPYGQKEES